MTASLIPRSRLPASAHVAIIAVTPEGGGLGEKQRPRLEPEGESDGGGTPQAGGSGSVPCQGISMSSRLAEAWFVSRPGVKYEQCAHESGFPHV